MQLVIACGWVPLEGKLSLGVTLTLLVIPGRGALHTVYLHSSFCCGLNFQIISLLPDSTGFPVQDESSLQIINKLFCSQLTSISSSLSPPTPLLFTPLVITPPPLTPEIRHLSIQSTDLLNPHHLCHWKLPVHCLQQLGSHSLSFSCSCMCS